MARRRRRDRPLASADPVRRVASRRAERRAARAQVFAGTSFAVEMTKEALRRARQEAIPVYNLNVDEPPNAVAHAALLKRHSVLMTCDTSFPRLKALVDAKLKERGLTAPPSDPKRADDDASDGDGSSPPPPRDDQKGAVRPLV